MRLLYGSWLSLTFFSWTVYDRAFYWSTWLGSIRKTQAVASNPALLASSGLLRRHDDDSMGTCAGGIARGKHYFTGPASVSATFTAACGDAWRWFISEAVRKEEAFPLKLAAQRWGNLGQSEGGLHLQNILQHTKACTSISSKTGSTHATKPS